ncbi:MAG: 3-hydroxyacyl-CoA dehydrogenase NAD-binding domain-containing protein [Thermoguttaceae bacterium]
MLNAASENVRWIAAWGRQAPVAARPIAFRRIARVGIVGAGQMGTAIAAAHVQHRMPVVILDADPGAMRRATERIAEELRRSESHLPWRRLERLVRPTPDLAELSGCDLVLEAVAETVAAKSRLFDQMRPHLNGHAIVATNTSTIPLEKLSGKIADSSRFCGLHFCHPVRERPLVEIVRGPDTSNATVAEVSAHVRRIDRIALLTSDGPGFVVNRILFPYLSEALAMVGQGVPLGWIERAATEFGMAMGPLRMIDEIGLDTILQAAWVLNAAFPERVVASPLLVSMVKAGRLGRKLGAGFFSYPVGHPEDSPGVADPAVEKIVKPWVVEGRCPSQRVTTFRLLLPMVLEATRLLDEGKVRDARDVDLAVLFGLGFPAEQGGLLWWADTLGAGEILETLALIQTSGATVEATPMLRRLAADRGRFYQFESPER